MHIGGLKKVFHLGGTLVSAGECAVGTMGMVKKLAETGKGRDGLKESENFGSCYR